MNHTLGYKQEYKVNFTPTYNAIDSAIRYASKQAQHIVLRIDSEISFNTLTSAVYNRVKRKRSIVDITIIYNNTDRRYCREEIMRRGFKITKEDLK